MGIQDTGTTLRKKDIELAVKRKIKRTGSFFVYIVQCSKGTYYAGYTSDLEKRIKLHNNGTGAKYLRGRAPVKLVYEREYKYYKNAINAEISIKKMTRKEKENFIANSNPPGK